LLAFVAGVSAQYHYLKTALDIWSFLKDIGSPRADGFRLACDKKFELSTVFKTPDEVAVIHSQQDALSKAQGVDD
jgi:peptide alpha-N-acetyltransferase